MRIHKITPSVDYNKWLKRLYILLNEPTNQNSIKVAKVVESMIRKRHCKTLGTSILNSPITPSHHAIQRSPVRD